MTSFLKYVLIYFRIKDWNSVEQLLTGLLIFDKISKIKSTTPVCTLVCLLKQYTDLLFVKSHLKLSESVYNQCFSIHFLSLTLNKIHLGTFINYSSEKNLNLTGITSKIYIYPLKTDNKFLQRIANKFTWHLLLSTPW